MSSYQILNDWDEITRLIPDYKKDIFFTAKYHKLFLNTEKALPEAFVYHQNNKLLLLPYLKRKLNEHIPYTKYQSYYDLTSPYGYTGIFGNINDKLELIKFTKNFTQYCNNNKIVSAFFRIHPIISRDLNENLINKKIVNQLIIINLDDNIETILSSFKHSTRKSIRKAREANITVKKFNKIPMKDFKNIYFSTLDNRNAEEYYYFNNSFFKELNDKLCGDHLTYIAYLDNKPISAEIVMKSKYYWHSYLGGTLPEYLKSCANSLIKYNIIIDAYNSKAKLFILGGGKKIDDGIFKYKKGFSPEGVTDFSIQCSIFNKSIYNDLILEWEKRSKDKSLGEGFFQKYLLG